MGPKSKSTAKRSRTKTKNRSSNSNSRILSLKGNLNSNSKKRAANRQFRIITIRRSSGRREKFNTERIAQTVSRSGVPFIMPQHLHSRVNIRTQPKNKGKCHEKIDLSLPGKSDRWLLKS
jgi:hypothetical protein